MKTIYIKLISGGTITIKVEKPDEMTISQLKKKISDDYNYDRYILSLVYEGNYPEDDTLLSDALSAYNDDFFLILKKNTAHNSLPPINNLSQSSNTVTHFKPQTNQSEPAPNEGLELFEAVDDLINNLSNVKYRLFESTSKRDDMITTLINCKEQSTPTCQDFRNQVLNWLSDDVYAGPNSGSRLRPILEGFIQNTADLVETVTNDSVSGINPQ